MYGSEARKAPLSLLLTSANYEEKIMKIRNLVIASVLLTALLAIGTGLAQQGLPKDGYSQPCPHPTRLVLKGSNPVSFDASDFSPSQLALLNSSQPLMFNQ